MLVTPSSILSSDFLSDHFNSTHDIPSRLRGDVVYNSGY
jgi:hypothetical protein